MRITIESMTISAHERNTEVRLFNSWKQPTTTLATLVNAHNGNLIHDEITYNRAGSREENEAEISEIAGWIIGVDNLNAAADDAASPEVLQLMLDQLADELDRIG